ncbi:MAG: hypothetical protein AAF658_16140, partial [Myxococcota bacterium]
MGALRLVAAATIVLLYSCVSDTECGPGTRLEGERCVRDGFIVNTICAPGTSLVDGECVPAGASGSCAAGTELVNGQCRPLLPPGTLFSFAVDVTPVGCDVVVSGLVPARVTVTALDSLGARVNFTGQVDVIGLGGIVLSPGVLGGFTNGVATGEFNVAGLAANASISVLESALGQVTGRSSRFTVAAESETLTLVASP